MAYFWFILLGGIWGSNFILMKKASVAFGPIGIAAWRVLVGGLMLAFFWRITQPRWPFAKRDFWPLIGLTFVGYIWPYSALPYVIARNGSAFGGMMIGLVPLMTILVSVPILKTLPTRRQLFGVLGGLFCLALILRDGMKQDVPFTDALLAATVPLCYASGNSYIKRRFQAQPPLAMSCICLLIASVILFPLAQTLPSEQVRTGPGFATAALALTLSALFATGLAGYLVYKLIQDYGPLHAGLVTYLVPIGALVWGWADGEAITPVQVLALAGILIMVGIAEGGGGKKAAAKPAQSN